MALLQVVMNGAFETGPKKDSGGTPGSAPWGSTNGTNVKSILECDATTPFAVTTIPVTVRSDSNDAYLKACIPMVGALADDDTAFYDYFPDPGGTLYSTFSQKRPPTFSDQYTGKCEGGNTSYPCYNAFDGSTATFASLTVANGKWSKLTFEEPLEGVTSINYGYDGEGDIGYNGSITDSSIGYSGSRQSISVYSGAAITLTNLYFVSQPGNGVVHLYDVTINGTTLTWTGRESVPAAPTTANGATVDINNFRFYTYCGNFRPSGDSHAVACIELPTAWWWAPPDGTAVTVEFWGYIPSGMSSWHGFFQSSTQKTGGLSNAWWSGAYHEPGGLTGYMNIHAQGGGITTGAGDIPEDQWFHYALVRNTSNLFTMYINGDSKGTATETGLPQGTGWMIGQHCSGGGTNMNLRGYMQDFRYYYGLEKYTGNFTGG